MRAIVLSMLIALICIYLGVWGCAYASAHRLPGRAGFWGLYAVAGLVVPGVFSGLFHLVCARVDPENAPDLAATVLLLGMVLGVLSFPLSRARIRRGGGR